MCYLASKIGIPASVGIMIASPEFITEVVPEERRGFAMGILVSIQNFALGFGAIAGGGIPASLGTFKGNFLVGTIFCIIALVIAIFFVRSKESK